MLLGGAHDSRRQHEAPRRAVRGSSGPLCRAWGSLLQGLPPNPMARGRAVEGGSKYRFVSTRTDSWAYGHGRLLIFAQPDS